ncbi:MAG: CDC27 family protein [Thermoplasmata archaeon]
MKIIDTLLNAYQGIDNGGKIILLEGNEGSGKTSIINEFCNKIKEENTICINLSFAGYSENLGVIPEAEIIKALEKSIPESHKKAFQNFFIFEEKDIISVITLIASIYKVILIFDDAEDAPSSILNNILYLGMNHRDKKMIILLSYNPYLISKNMNEFMIKLNTIPENYIQKIRISPMSSEEAKEIVSKKGYNFPDYVIERINQVANGNVRNFIDIINYLQSRNVVDRDGYFIGNYNDLDTIAVSTLNNYLLSLLASLKDEEIDFLSCAAIVGFTFSRDEIKYLMKIDDDRFNNIAEKLVKMNILSKNNDNEYSFTNRIFIDTVLKKYISNLKKKVLSKKLAEYYESRNENNIKIGSLYMQAGETLKSFEYLKKGIEEFFSQKNYRGVIELYGKISNAGKYDDYFIIGYSYYKTGKFERALEFFMKGKNDLKSQIYAALSYIDLGNVIEAERLLKEIDESKLNQDTQYLYYFSLALIEEKNLNFSREEEYLLKAKEIAEIQNDPEKLAYIYKQMGIYYYLRGEFEKASSYFESSLVYFNKIRDYDGIGRIYNNLAILNHAKNVNISKEYYEKALSMGYLAGNNYILFVINYNLSIMNFWSGNVVEAEKLINVANKLSKMLNEFDVRHAINAMMADINTMHGRFSIARDYIDDAIEITENHNYIYYNDLYSIKKNTINIIFGSNPNLEEINDYAERIYKNPMTPLIPLVHGEIGISYFFMGDLQLSLKFLESSIQRARKMFLPFDYVFYEGMYLSLLFILDYNRFQEIYSETKAAWDSYSSDNIFLRLFEEFDNEIDIEKEYVDKNLFLPLYLLYLLKYHRTKDEEYLKKAKDLSEKFRFNDVLIKKIEKI